MAGDLTQTLAQIIATNRQAQGQNFPMGQGPHMGRLPTLENVKPSWGGDIGQAFGKGAGDVVGDVVTKKVMWENDPQILYKRAEMAQTHWNTMTPEEQEQMLQNPKFGETMAKFQKSAPELFTTTANGKIVPGPLPMQEALMKNQFFMGLGQDRKKFDNYFFSDTYKKMQEGYKEGKVGDYYGERPGLERAEMEMKDRQHKEHMGVLTRGQDLEYTARMAGVQAQREHYALGRSAEQKVQDEQQKAILRSHLKTAEDASKGFNSTLQKFKLDPQKGLYAGANRMTNLGEVIVTGLGALDTARNSYENVPGAVTRDKETGAVSIDAPHARAISNTLFTELDHQAGILLDAAQQKRKATGGTWSVFGPTPLEQVTKDAPTIARYAIEVYRAYPTATAKERLNRILTGLKPYLPTDEEQGEQKSVDPMTSGMVK